MWIPQAPADWHAGQPPDRRARAAARRNGVDIGHYRGRQVGREDFYRFDIILALDRQNLKDLRAIAPADATATIGLLLDEVPGREGDAVADPYYGDDSGFDVTWADVMLAARHLARRLSEPAAKIPGLSSRASASSKRSK